VCVCVYPCVCVGMEKWKKVKGETDRVCMCVPESVCVFVWRVR
jgi:hypothetical protein